MKGCVTAGRVLLVIISLLVCLMPWTEYFWHFDKFLHGGQDMEFGLLLVATVWGLVVVLLRHGKSAINAVISALLRLSSVFLVGILPGLRSFSRRGALSEYAGKVRPGAKFCNFPIRI